MIVLTPAQHLLLAFITDSTYATNGCSDRDILVLFKGATLTTLVGLSLDLLKLQQRGLVLAKMYVRAVATSARLKGRS